MLWFAVAAFAGECGDPPIASMSASFSAERDETHRAQTGGSVSLPVAGVELAGGAGRTTSDAQSTGTSATISAVAMSPGEAAAEREWNRYNLCLLHEQGLVDDARWCAFMADYVAAIAPMPDQAQAAAARDDAIARCMQREEEPTVIVAAAPPAPTLSPPSFVVTQQAANDDCTRLGDACYRVSCTVANTGEQAGDATVLLQFIQNGNVYSRQQRVTIGGGSSVAVHEDFHEGSALALMYRYGCGVR